MAENKVIKIGSVRISNDNSIALISGPCVIESRDCVLKVAEHLVNLTYELGIPFIFKASFDKANRTSIDSKRGVPLDESLRIFEEIKEIYGCPVLTDVHESQQCAQLADVVDVLQIPAFLCRQTDLLVAAAKTGKVIHVKKAQFLAPWDMENVCKKITSSGNDNIMLCERGTCFGYNRLVSDMRSLKILGDFGYPVIFDATHSIQEPGGLGSASGGRREYIEPLARAAVSVGVAGIFMETHPDPVHALSDGPNMVPLHAMRELLITVQQLDELAKRLKYTDMSC
ncbi:MAG: 3-deoxy-8-phosphooctulonate synthase [Holosporaceae bacterium]|jgi:2-dehydro-3-deoxyphosphooctonate aldolase (KDO 8-P synthase)|nr:3-deoxy-8-phosphooctulonate synthase [Holosporaceae bacterium]